MSPTGLPSRTQARPGLPSEDMGGDVEGRGQGIGVMVAVMVVAMICPAWTSPRGRRRSWGWDRDDLRKYVYCTPYCSPSHLIPSARICVAGRV